MRLLTTLGVGSALLFASTAQAQQSDLFDIAATDAGLVEGEALQTPAYSWVGLSSNFYNRSRPGGNFVGTNYYLIGGELSAGTWGINRADTVEIFNGITGTWSSSSSLMPVPVSNIMGSTAAQGGKIYVFGGYDAGAGYSSLIQIYDTTTDSWSTSSATMPMGGIYGCLAVNIGQGQIFVCGGRDAFGTTYSDAYIFDTATETFFAVAPMPSARYHLTGDFNGRQVMACAGFGTGTVLESYDLASGTWTTHPAIPVDRAGCGVIAVGPWCVMFGGDWGGYRNDASAFNMITGTYNAAVAASLGTMPVGKRAFAYGDFQSPARTAFVGMDGWAGAFLDDCAAIF